MDDIFAPRHHAVPALEAVALRQLRLPLEPPSPNRPGVLLRFLTWAAQPLLDLATEETALMRNLLVMDRERMHAIALLLDHGVDLAQPGLATWLARARTGEII